MDKLGYIQKELIRLGKLKGFVTSDEVRKFYARNIEMEMNKLVAQGFFESGKDFTTFIKWKFKND